MSVGKRGKVMELERKFCRFDAAVTMTDGCMIEGYASRFGDCDQGNDIVASGAYAASLTRLAEQGRAVKMLWQHDPAQPIGIWDTVREDATGLYVKGRLLDSIARGREAAALVAAGVIDGLSIGYRTKAATKDRQGRRVLTELELWEVSLVTFPMLPSARVAAKGEAPELADLREMARLIDEARQTLVDG